MLPLSRSRSSADCNFSPLFLFFCSCFEVTDGCRPQATGYGIHPRLSPGLVPCLCLFRRRRTSVHACTFVQTQLVPWICTQTHKTRHPDTRKGNPKPDAAVPHTRCLHCTEPSRRGEGEGDGITVDGTPSCRAADVLEIRTPRGTDRCTATCR